MKPECEAVRSSGQTCHSEAHVRSVWSNIYTVWQFVYVCCCNRRLADTLCRILNELKWIPAHCPLLKLFLTTCGLVHCSLVEIWTVGSCTKPNNHSVSWPVIFTLLLASFLLHIHWRAERLQSLLVSHSLSLSFVFARFFMCVCVWCVLAPGHLIDLFP